MVLCLWYVPRGPQGARSPVTPASSQRDRSTCLCHPSGHTWVFKNTVWESPNKYAWSGVGEFQKYQFILRTREHHECQGGITLRRIQVTTNNDLTSSQGLLDNFSLITPFWQRVPGPSISETRRCDQPLKPVDPPVDSPKKNSTPKLHTKARLPTCHPNNKLAPG